MEQSQSEKTAVNCCNEAVEGLDPRHLLQKRTLYIVLILNLVMFFIGSISGILENSTGLLADSVDMLGDAGIYALTIVAIHKTAKWQANASLAKGITMSVLATAVMFEAVHKLVFTHSIPNPSAMGIVSLLALTVNITSTWMLLKFRSDNLNMKSVWLCSRNDAIANLGVIGAGFLVAMFHSALPDVLIGIGIALVALKSGLSIISTSRKSLLRL